LSIESERNREEDAMTTRDPDRRVFEHLLARLLAGKLSRRQAITQAAALGLSASALATLETAAVPGSRPALVAAAPDAAPKPGSVRKFGLQADPVALDAHKQSLIGQISQPWWDEASPPWWAPEATGWTYHRLADARLSPACQELLDGLRAEVPGPPAGGYEPGQLAAPILFEEQLFVCLLRAALAQGEAECDRFVWQDLDSELAVHHQESRAALLEGLVLVGLPTSCDQIPSTAVVDNELVVPLAVGTPNEPAGLAMAAEPVARGPELLVNVWGETAIAAAWLALVDVCRFVAELAGGDQNCRPLLPGAVSAESGVLAVVPQAQHAIDAGKW
jgi:hypothetical protein